MRVFRQYFVDPLKYVIRYRDNSFDDNTYIINNIRNRAGLKTILSVRHTVSFSVYRVITDSSV